MATNEEIISDAVNGARKLGFNMALDIMEVYAKTFVRSGAIFECIEKVREKCPEFKERELLNVGEKS